MMSDQKTITVTRVVQTCTACPSQWDAWTADGTYVYVRYRSGFLTVDVGWSRVFELIYGDSLSGHITWAEVLALTPLMDQTKGINSDE
jgi:hypothetical protein